MAICEGNPAAGAAVLANIIDVEGARYVPSESSDLVSDCLRAGVRYEVLRALD